MRCTDEYRLFLAVFSGIVFFLEPTAYAASAAKAPYSVDLLVQPSTSATSGQEFGRAPAFWLTDKRGFPVIRSLRGVAAQAFVDSGCIVPATGALNSRVQPFFALLGLGIFENMTFSGDGDIYIRVSAQDAESACSSKVRIAPVAHHLALIAGDQQNAEPGASLPVAPRVRVVSATGKGVSGIPLRFDVTLGGGKTSVSSAVSDAEGYASTNFTLGLIAGLNTLKVSRNPLPSSGGPWSVNFNETAKSNRPVASVLALSGAASATAGQCFSFRVESRDSNGQPAAVTEARAIAVTGLTQLYADSQCGAATPSVRIEAGASAATFYARETHSGSLSVSAASAGLSSPPSLSVAIAPAAPALIEKLSGDHQQAILGQALSAPLSVRVTDEFGNPVESTAVQFRATRGEGSLLPADASTDHDGLTASRLTLGNLGLNQVTVSLPVAPSAPAAVFDAVALPKPVAGLAVSPATGSARAGECSVAFKLAPVDSEGRATSSSSDIAVTVTGLPAHTLYSDAACTQEISPSSLLISAALGAAEFHLSSRVAVTLAFDAAIAQQGASAAHGSFAISAGPAKALKFNSSPSSAGEAGVPLASQPSIVALDEFGNLALDFEAAIQLSTFSDAACTTAASVPLQAKLNPMNAAQGLASFEQVSLGSAVVAYVRASADGLTSVCSNSVTVVSPVRLAVGSSHTCALQAGGVKCWGFNGSGNLGAGSTGVTSSSATPVPVFGLQTGVRMIAAGGNHTCAVTDSGISCWGSNFSGELGSGSLAGISVTPLAVSGLPSIGQIRGLAAGDSHSCALIGDSVYCWGANASGQLGTGNFDGSNVALSVNGLPSGIRSIAAGANGTCATMNNGSAACWGANGFGQLGNGEVTDRNIPVTIAGLSGVISVMPGADYACALVDHGVRCWGRNQGGQLGDGSLLDRLTPAPVPALEGNDIRELSVGLTFSCAVDSAGDVTCWGANNRGQLGDARVSGNQSSLPVDVSGLVGAVNVSAGLLHACATTDDGLFCWGWGRSGQLGQGTFLESGVPVEVQGY
jgi:alpha-tubulin suppressor-like RCC1 family protein